MTSFPSTLEEKRIDQASRNLSYTPDPQWVSRLSLLQSLWIEETSQSSWGVLRPCWRLAMASLGKKLMIPLDYTAGEEVYQRTRARSQSNNLNQSRPFSHLIWSLKKNSTMHANHTKLVHRSEVIALSLGVVCLKTASSLGVTHERKDLLEDMGATTTIYNLFN